MIHIESDPVARANHIEELVGMRPDPRSSVHGGGGQGIPLEETKAFIEGVQAGDQQAAAKLIATRLVWLYSGVAGSAEVQSRYDLQLEDILQLGCVAVLEAANKTNTHTSPSNCKVIFKNRETQQVGAALLRTKLVPSVRENGRLDTSHARLDSSGRQGYFSLHDKRIIDQAELEGDVRVRERVEADRTTIPPSIEDEVFQKAAFQSLYYLLYQSSIRPPKNAVEIHSFPGQLANLAVRFNLEAILRQGIDEDATNTGLAHPDGDPRGVGIF
jgi:hypothetical protein